MVARKIVIEECAQCPNSDHQGGFGPVAYIPVCRKAGRNLPYDTKVGFGNIVRARQVGGIPSWCLLEKNTPSQPAADSIQHPRAGDTQPVAVSQTLTMLDAREFPPPIGVKILCGSTRTGITVVGHFDPSGPAGHDCWLPLPAFPASLKRMR